MSDVADAFLADPYFAQPPPKSTDGPAMITIFERALAGRSVTIDDQLATAAYVTAVTVARAIPIRRGVGIIASGGGTKNAAIMNALRAELGDECTFASPDQQGVPSDAKEAMAFALLGAATLDHEPSNVPSVTGARRAVVLGSITPKPC
jgi:anhydro-N-acetylmuramic acid kinase